ncbi:MAG: NlpC/P60 family protein [Ilumatobacteraceae bacterium]
MPARVTGDNHSPTVVVRADEALAASDVFDVTGTPAAFVAYVADRNATADAVAIEMSLDPVALRDAWARADLQHQKALLAALTQLGAPYRSATSDPAVGFDCSGLTAYAWARAGAQLARQSGSQINAAARRDAASAVAGDLMQYPGHVMMYLGIGQAIVHASNPATDVELSFTDRSVRWADPTG